MLVIKFQNDKFSYELIVIVYTFIKVGIILTKVDLK